MAQVIVDYGKAVQFKKGFIFKTPVTLKFAHFALRFLREENTRGPGPLSFTWEVFELISPNERPKEIKACSEAGALPPGPEFDISGSRFQLHVANFNGHWLNADELVVTKVEPK